MVEDFAQFLFEQKMFRHKIVVAGNHDFCFEDKRRAQAEKLFQERGIVYLCDTGVEIEGFKFWGSPVQPWFMDWAFNMEEGEPLKRHWEKIPSNTDVLITHTPPFGILDQTIKKEHVGCKELLKKVMEIKPLIHAFGHIHESYGLRKVKQVQFINASSLDRFYTGFNEPIKTSLDPLAKKRGWI